jgi:superfamily II DNA helicase RecQ
MVFSNKLRLLLVQKIGQGKAAAFYATALLNGVGVNVICCPLKSLAINQENRTLDWSIQGVSLVHYLFSTAS